MITGDLVRHCLEDNSFGVVMSVDTRDARVLWLDHDSPTVEFVPKCELVVTSSIDLDWENDVIMFKS